MRWETEKAQQLWQISLQLPHYRRIIGVPAWQNRMIGLFPCPARLVSLNRLPAPSASPRFRPVFYSLDNFRICGVGRWRGSCRNRDFRLSRRLSPPLGIPIRSIAPSPALPHRTVRTVSLIRLSPREPYLAAFSSYAQYDPEVSTDQPFSNKDQWCSRTPPATLVLRPQQASKFPYSVLMLD
jgi:hypothetical protein